MGLPPGAEIDRGTLAIAIDDTRSGLDSLKVAPDRMLDSTK